MGTLELSSTAAVCRRCGQAYGRLKGNFSTSYAPLYKGVGYLPYCKTCVDEMFNLYMIACNDSKMAVRQMCRKLDLYWSDTAFEYIEKRNNQRTIMTAYIARINSTQYVGKSYDDTLAEEGQQWNFSNTVGTYEQTTTRSSAAQKEDLPEVTVDPEIVDFWGEDYAPEFLLKLDRRYKGWTAGQDDLEPAAVSLFKHICILEETIAIDSAAGRPFDKNLNTLNGLLGSLNMKPVQKKDDAVGGNVDSSPMGVWIRRFENERPIPEPDPELRDVDKIVRYIQIFFLGHLAKMLGKTTVYSKMYEEEIARLRVESPDLSSEYDDNDDFFEERFSAAEDGDES